MLRAFGLRYFAIAALVFAVGANDVAMASGISSSPRLYDLELGDEDGDGIPDYLDPVDNPEQNDPEAGTGAATDDLDLGDDDGDGIPNYLDPHDDRESAPSSDTVAPGGNQNEISGEVSVPQQQVTSLPNTGAGNPSYASETLAIALLLVAAGTLLTTQRWYRREQ